MNVTSDKYLQIKKQLVLGPSLIPNVLFFVFVCGLLAIGFALSSQSSIWPTYVAGQLILGIAFFQSFTFLHECGHGNVSNNKTVNAVLGHFVSPFCLLPYYPWKYIHIEHHRWSGNPARDPTLKALSKRRLTKKVGIIEKVLWWLWIPVVGIIQQTVFWRYPLEMMKREETRVYQLWACVFSLAWIPACFVIACSFLPTVFNALTLIPAFIVFFAIYEIINLPHHSDQPFLDPQSPDKRLRFWEQHITTRSCYYPKWISELLFMNFNFHIEHHFFPNLSWHRLRHARDIIKSELGESYNESHGIDWSFENRIKDPKQVFLTEQYIVLEEHSE